MTDKIIIAAATRDDSRDVWTWRNDPQTRAMSVATEEVSWHEHAAWYESSLDDRNRFLYVGRLALDEKVGMCRFDVDASTATAAVSINLNPKMRGRKLSQQLLAAAISAFWKVRRMRLVATIKRQNTASIRCFSSCGFVLNSEDGEHFHYRLDPGAA